jgi:ribosomal protein S15P/S13E
MGSFEFQVVFGFTNKIWRLTSHLKLCKEEFSCQIALKIHLGNLRGLWAYLANKNRICCKKLYSKLVEYFE